MTIRNGTAVSYDPFDAGINADPYPTFRRLREEAPIYYNEPYDVWALARHADVERGLVDWQTAQSNAKGESVSWQGQWKGDGMKGVLSFRSAGQNPQGFSFLSIRWSYHDSTTPAAAGGSK